MRRRSSRPPGLIAALLAAAVLLAGCGSSSTSTSSSAGAVKSGSASQGAGGTLIVSGAGTLAEPFAQEIAAFKAQHPGVTVHSQFGASGDRVKAITQLGEPADVLGVADYSLIPKEMFGARGAKRYATWYAGFVSNQITFAYTGHSQGAGELTPANWFRLLARPGVHIGRSNPSADPSGYQILQMLKLAQGYYHDPSLSASILKNSPAASEAETETSLIAALQSGQLDYLAVYRSDALQHHFRYVHLPPQISLSDPALAKTYATVSTVGTSGKIVKAKPIIYGLTVPTNAPDKSLGEQFVRFVLGPQGQAIMRANGFVVISPALASSQSTLPPALRPLTRSWSG
ncbi:MAG TPA: extracellular solute-binding protein [Solirubrobacteraceae bacterium]|nr:extracellular solute-binding protein [Solirubrobacteraceae bacterium]